MPSEKLTDRRIKTARAEGERLELWDLNMPGLGLRIAPDSAQGPGVKTWFVRYRFQGAQRRLKLGLYPALQLSDAHKAAREVFKLIAAGTDPAAEKQAEPAQEADTFQQVAESFISRHVKVKNRPTTAKAVERTIMVELIKPWGKRPVQSITRRDVIELLDAIVDSGRPVMANRTLAAARKLFNWAIERDIIQASPCDRVKPPGNETERQRVLTDEELRIIWRASGAVKGAFGGFVRICMLTAQRRSETAAMRWQDLDLDKGLWTIPREVTKGDRAHEVPLSSLALEVLIALPRIGDYVFPGREAKAKESEPKAKPKVEGKPINGFTSAKARLDAQVLKELQTAAKKRGDDPDEVQPMDTWTIHDLRRTAATGMARLGVPRLVISKIENHAEGGVTKLYDRYAYEAEKRDALDRWGAKVRSMVSPTPDNVVQLQKA
ncbi:tyrosine-type recombinase/integrase [Azospirillum picis]|uniref:Integrase n=1 Tax=Azospirillum picis TaxID=488438 RepID=A0ABU0MS25_9PROT|nr:site-specific integrase [Azospirillum picis]MBP2302493.1 integrase [Azospirillum picis]MDQ0536265.1 integrase [Azospirillum picis]